MHARCGHGVWTKRHNRPELRSFLIFDLARLRAMYLVCYKTEPSFGCPARGMVQKRHDISRCSSGVGTGERSGGNAGWVEVCRCALVVVTQVCSSGREGAGAEREERIHRPRRSGARRGLAGDGAQHHRVPRAGGSGVLTRPWFFSEALERGRQHRRFMGSLVGPACLACLGARCASDVGLYDVALM